MKSDISGFPEFLPNEQIVFNNTIDIIKKHFESYGFVPMDTAAVERVSTLLAKGNDNEIYGLYRLAEKSKDATKDLGLRFDLTVPLARYVSSNFGKLVFPHRRYQISPVWRGERPQFGRYRQFYQCDIDIVGDGELSISHDAEIIALITEVLVALNVPPFSTKISNRKMLTGFLKTIIAEEKITGIVKLIDKIDKISLEEFYGTIEKYSVSKKDMDKLKSFLDVEKKGSNADILKWLKPLNFNAEFNAGVAELEEIINLLRKFDIEDNRVKISTKLARGLAYYTGSVFETTFDDLKDIGSISGGGRYDDLAAMISNKKIPGVGASIGISRLIPKLIDSGYINSDKFSTAQLLVTVQDRNFIGSYMKLSSKFRKLGIKTETYLQEKPLGPQLNYAHRKGIKYVLIANDLELLENRAIIRNLQTKEQTIIRTEYMGKEIVELLR
jgi:histidyl-tRNA synthetase